MKKITFKQFKRINYNPKGISNYRLVECNCVKCHKILNIQT